MTVKKLTLLLGVASFGSIVYAQEGSFTPTFSVSASKEKLGKPAPWMRPKTEASILVDKSKLHHFPKGYVVDAEETEKLSKEGLPYIRAKKALPVSGREEFWNKFISGYSDDKAVA